jgi:hypothetical protein
VFPKAFSGGYRMKFFEISASDISALDDDDLRELVGRLCEAEIEQQGLSTSGVLWGGAQEAADGGIDVSVTAEEGLKSPVYVPKAYTGFQVKKHSMGKAACTQEMLDKGTVKPIIAELASKQGAYIIVSGKDDCSDKMLKDRLDGMRSAIGLLGTTVDLKVDFYGRDRIAAWLRKHPGVSLWARHKLGDTLSGWQPFGRWASTPKAMDDTLLTDDHPCVFDANSTSKAPITLLEGIKLVREKLRSGGGVVRIAGLSGVGKSRFAQALFEEAIGEDPLPKASAIYADLGDDLRPTAFEIIAYLIANDFAAYLVLDNCPPDVHRTLQLKVTSSGTKLRLLSIEYDISDDKPEETEVIYLEPASEETVSKLVQRRFPELGRLNSDKVAEFSGGNARVALVLASRVEADETLTNFSDTQLFQRLFSQRKGKDDGLLRSAEALSLVYSFNTSGEEFNDELSAIGRIVGIDRNELHRHQAELLRRQIAQKRGNWGAVLPHALANRLARRALENLPKAQVNAELFKPENERLFKSCAHRVGYLHDSDAARDLANSWIGAGAPLEDVSSCSAEQLACLSYIAPVFPETLIASLELAAAKPGFASRDNPSFVKIVRLLCQLAYQDDTFERVSDLILLFSETEAAGEKNNSVVGYMKHLFSLYLSGTDAAPTRRQAYVAKLFNSSNHRHNEIAVELLHSAFQAAHWTSSFSFDFGARRRGSGWRPSTNADLVQWYCGFISILADAINRSDQSRIAAAKKLLAGHFRGLWTFAGCFEVLEDIVKKHSHEGDWPDMWIAIKNTIHFDGASHTPELLNRLKNLEACASPNDPYSEMEAYVLCNRWEHVQVKSGNYTDAAEEINEKIIKLGVLACSEPRYMERLGERLWEKHIDSLWTFGRGLARGSQDKAETFEFLVASAEKSSLTRIHPGLLGGFIHEVHEHSPRLARTLQEAVLEQPKLKEHFVHLLCAAPLEPWGVRKLIELARDGAIDASNYAHISFGRIHEAIGDEDLAVLIYEVTLLPNGISTVLQILEMRFFSDKDNDYRHNEAILSAGRRAIKHLMAMKRDEIRPPRSHGFDRVCQYCLGKDAPISEVSEIVELLFDGIESYRLYSFELGDIISHLVKNFPELVLNSVLVGGESEKLRSHMVFRDRSIGLREASLNEAPIDRLLAWCGKDQEKVTKLSELVCPFTAVEGGGISLENSSKAKLSDHMMAILNVTHEKTNVVKTIFARIWPSGGWSGSLADILEVRGRAVRELSEYPSPEVRQMVGDKLRELEMSILKERASEADENNRREQRFE